MITFPIFQWRKKFLTTTTVAPS